MKAIAKLWIASAPLTTVGVLMLPALLGAVAGLWLDPRTITGAPAWLKPAKFAASIAIYSFTLAWVFTYLPDWPRMRRIVGWTTAVAMLVEIVIIDAQAWRGVASHFNVSTPLDGALFTIMGLTIVIQTVTSIAVAVALWRQPLPEGALAWALRFGMTITIVGALAGGLMTRPTTQQLDRARTTHQMPVAGAHTVGAPDGGPALPGTGWSSQHGDLRVAHFVGLHALQALMLVALVLPRRWSASLRARVMKLTSASYAALFVILIWQALRGQSLIAPDALTVAVLALWATLTAFDFLNVLRRERHIGRVDDAIYLIGATRADNRGGHRRVA